VERIQRARKHHHVGKGEIHTLRSGRRHDMGAVTGKEKAAVLHRLDDETAHRSDALLQHLAFLELARAAKTLVQFIPNAVVGPILDILIVVALQIESSQSLRPHRVQRKSAIGIGIDELMIRRRAFGENAEPAEGIIALEYSEHSIRNGRLTHPVKAVATRNEVAIEFLRTACMAEPDFWFLLFEVVDSDVVDFEQQRSAAGEP